MADTPATESKHYVLIIDENRDVVLNALLQAAAVSEVGRFIFQNVCRQHGVSNEEIKSFYIEISEKAHALNWCEDPNCQHKK